MIETTELGNGMTVVTERTQGMRSVSAGFWVGTGSRDEAPGMFGASHFLEHLLFKGTAARTARRIAEEVDAVGGDMNAFTTKEYTAFYLRVLDDSLGLGLDILSDILWSPAFRPEEVEAERQVILEEILMRADEPADLVHEVFTEALFPDHPVGREVLGDEETIEAMSREDIAAFHAHHYRPGNVVFAAAGQLDHAAVVDGVARRFAGARGGAAPDRAVPVDPPRALAVDARPTEQVHLVLGVRSLDRHDEDRYALAVVNHVLGGGLSSRLFQKIREERGLAYSVYSYRAAFADSGALAVYAGTMPSRVAEVVGLVRDELDAMAGHGITPRELEVAKGHLVGEMALSLEDSAARMSRIGRSQLVHGTVLTVDQVAERIAAVTMEDVERVAATVLGNERVLAAVGPVDSGELDVAQVA
ncbi:MAG TPA: pitrilysin family protein [Acidimicrobiales bacterium]|nr:pitrilysin family protein [Acidimicrobiales bacterium]